MQKLILAAMVALAVSGCAAADPQVLAAQDRCAEAERGASSQGVFEACTLVIERGRDTRQVAFAFNRRGMLHRRAGRDDEALQDFDAAIRLEPYYSGAYNNRANIYNARGEDARAEQSYLTAIQTKPDNAMAHNNYAWYLATRGRYDDALISVNRAAALKSGSDVICDTRAHVLMGLGQVDEAQSAFECAFTGGAEIVRGYQQTLIAKGYAPGRTDGVVDDATRAALTACIRDNCRLMLE